MSTEILAPMPGTIIEVLVSPGDEVVEGQELLILEAMKMENPIVSTIDGKIKEINVAVDDKVATKQVMLTIE
ncbi:MAG: acetyl-CoA carboxylase biotin carboxyl carrier protein subunit [Proteobacteria bacterium]|nr:acetyl-CoA carboxylase biotin carboxyl carrier protein subunit [Desulfobacula sp.]MBU3954428.1 acetyl-CoA carboxylase biotin carboxyl carrier protein subunit [Pseudomonadota bacterium]MBU4130312.1 acetyl-CoA carboxylase biotin carboxyl carrier protein subunit [Pseudomonadota bacterium]